MMFLPHYKTTVKNKSIVLSGLWTTRLVKINLGSIVQVEQVPYDGTYLINNPVYNLQKKGKKKMADRGFGKVNIPHDVFLKMMKK
jgi:hypothetical protein